jgi:CheY-like chemotaxis protein
MESENPMNSPTASGPVRNVGGPRFSFRRQGQSSCRRKVPRHCRDHAEFFHWGVYDWRKKRSISRLASGPRGFVYEPAALPPDPGEGMDSDTLAKAVEPFFSTKGVGKGTGLGLSMVHGLAEQSGGAFHLESTVGQGTTANLWLPVASGQVERTAIAVLQPGNTAPATILLVDDDALIAASTAALLEDLGHKVVEANSGREALDLLDGGLQPDLIITDHAMPGMTGMELAVRARSRKPDIPILLATGYAEPEGGQPIDLPRLAKPFTQDQLSAEIGRLLPID